MLSVVTGQAPTTLERKTTSGEKQYKKKTIYTQELKQIVYLRKKKEKARSATVHTYQDTYRMLNESKQEPKPRRRHNIPKEDKMKQTMPEIELEKGEGRDENCTKPTDSKNARKVQPFGLVSVHGILHTYIGKRTKVRAVKLLHLLNSIKTMVRKEKNR